MEEYKKLLERAKQNLPDLTKKERFEIPLADVFTGRQTFIRNFSEIAKTLRREPKHLAKFLFKELAVPGSTRGEELILQGKVSTNLINQRIAEYVKEFVLCEECGKPDTIMQKDDRLLQLKCEACGAKRYLKTI
ncbi:MAG: translation initiation factor IF-2 subunit beta [Candidatus Aenigmatarchaeota archaeon]